MKDKDRIAELEEQLRDTMKVNNDIYNISLIASNIVTRYSTNNSRDSSIARNTKTIGKLAVEIYESINLNYNK